MSRSSLKAGLARERTTFQSILTETRAEMARDYLCHGHYSIKEIAFLLGFADATTFTRAFRAWTGEPPARFAAARRRGGRAT